MKLRKLLAAFLAAALLACCLPFAANAANEPTMLFVGEKDKTNDNLIAKLDAVGKNGSVRVIAIDTATQAYYTLTYERENGVGYVLTFYNDYTMSEVIENRSAYCGLYCNGDLTVRIAGNVTFDVNDALHKGAYGWIVTGQLTIESATRDENGVPLPDYTAKVLNISGDKTKSLGEGESTAISANTVMLNDVTVNACGGYAAVEAKEALVMSNAYLNANTASDMQAGSEPQFAYSVVTKNLIQVGGVIRADGSVNIAAFYFRGGSHIFDEKVVVYAKDYVFAEDAYDGLWSDSFTLFRDPDSIPSCMRVVLGSSVAKISGNKLTLNRRGETVLALVIQCGRQPITMDIRNVNCTLLWWQWIPYIISGAWIDAILNR